MNLIDIDALPDSALLRPHELLTYRLWPGSKSSLWDAVRQGRFPAPVKCGANTTAFILGSVRAWQQNLTANTALEVEHELV